ncbi:MAG: hypothetical protein ABSG59_00685 [Verrucomicrobiota bacterium]|jgi:hypothetical protein
MNEKKQDAEMRVLHVKLLLVGYVVGVIVMSVVEWPKVSALYAKSKVAVVVAYVIVCACLCGVSYWQFTKAKGKAIEEHH